MSSVPDFSRSRVTTCGIVTVSVSVAVASSAASVSSPSGPSADTQAVLTTVPASMSRLRQDAGSQCTRPARPDRACRRTAPHVLGDRGVRQRHVVERDVARVGDRERVA